MNSDNQPLSEKYRRCAIAWVDADAAADLLEQTKSSVLAERMVVHADMPVNRAEQLVKSSPEWREHVTKIVEARKKANRLKVELEYIRMRFSEAMSEQANERTMAKL